MVYSPSALPWPSAVRIKRLSQALRAIRARRAALDDLAEAKVGRAERVLARLQDGVPRWNCGGVVYREIPLEVFYRDGDDSREFQQFDALVRARPGRHRAA